VKESSYLFQEAAEAPQVIRNQLRVTHAPLKKLGELLRARAPRAVITCARGSSDHAATFAKYLIETRARVLVSSAAPSTSSVYASGPDAEDVLFIAISQSGASADLVATTAAAKQTGALIVALVNAEHSPLAQLSDVVIPLSAGLEKSVAATKSFIASLAAIVNVVAAWRADRQLTEELEIAPALLEQAWKLNWSAAIAPLSAARNLYVVGRGLGFAIAQEAALKLKETCGLHAEAFSAAELKHGPLALVGKDFPVLMFVQDDETRQGTETLAAELVALGATVMIAGAHVPGAISLPTVRAHEAIEPLLMISSFYRMLDALAQTRGYDVDRPPHLHKITVTL
jgi:glucosamine--fructose-6-phosphate aminotransferase (isomerizing)